MDRLCRGALVLGSLAWVAAGVVVACSSFGDETAPPTATEGGADGANPPPPVDASTGDAGATRCAPGSAFAPATALAGLGAYSVEAVRFANNRQIVYLSLCPADGGKPGCDMYQGARTTADTYGSFAAMSGVNAPNFYDSYPTVTGDAQWILFGSSRDGGVKLFQAAAMDGIFKNPSPLDGLPGLGASNEPYLLADGHTLYFGASVSASSPQWDLYRTTGSVGAFATPAIVDGISASMSDEFAPVPSEDELELFFASSRAPGSNANLDMWMTMRATTSEPFGPPVRLESLSGAQNEFPTSLSPDGCELYYIRKTGSGGGVGTAYVARRTKP